MNVQTLIYLLLFFFVFCPLHFLFRFQRMKERKSSFTQEIGIFFLACSVLFILYITIFPNFLLIDKKIYISFKEENHHVNIVPFLTIKSLFSLISKKSHLTYAYINLLGNIFLFFPFAFLFRIVLTKRKGYQIFILSVLFSTMIEIIQIPMQRISDVDDIILNSIGAALGIITGHIFKHLKDNYSSAVSSR